MRTSLQKSLKAALSGTMFAKIATESMPASEIFTTSVSASLADARIDTSLGSIWEMPCGACGALDGIEPGSAKAVDAAAAMSSKVEKLELPNPSPSLNLSQMLRANPKETLKDSLSTCSLSSAQRLTLKFPVHDQ